MTKNVIILRPEPAATRTARLVANRGLTPVKVPLFKIQPVQWSVPDPTKYDGLLLTSTNGLRFAGPQAAKLRSLPVYAVGPVTADFARKAGFTVAAIGRGGIQDLLKHVPSGAKLLHLTGRDRMEQPTGPAVDQVVVYRSALLEDVDVGPIDQGVILVHSPRAGRRLAELAGDRKSKASIVAISDQTAQACGEGWHVIVHPKRPDEQSMVALAAELCEKPDEA